MDFIQVEDLRIRSTHGCNPHEREHAQDFVFAIKAGCDLSKAQTSDAIGDTVDFNFFSTTIKEVLSARSYYLLESMVHDIIEKLMEDERILELTVSVRKPEVLPDCVPGITITRSR